MSIVSTKPGGRPKKYDKVAYFGLKMHPEDKIHLQLLAKSENKPASTIIVDLVYKACEEKNITLKDKTIKQPLSTKEFLSLPLEKQESILREQALMMSQHYEIIEDNQPLLDY